MSAESTLNTYDLSNPHIKGALAELQGMIQQRYPTVAFEVAHGDDPEGVYLFATVDVDDTDEVVDVFVDRQLAMQVDEGLPVYVIPLRTAERVAGSLRARFSPGPRIVAGALLGS